MVQQPLCVVVAAFSLMVGVLACSGSNREELSAHSDAIFGGDTTRAWPNVVTLDGGCSGVLVHPELVVTAAHCGEELAIASVPESGESSAIEYCQPYPEADFGGTDIAYCVLRSPLGQGPIVPPATGCELEAVVGGARVTLVGYGLSGSDAQDFGTKRSGAAVIQRVQEELEVQSSGVGTCPGDSGGPAFLRVNETDWRLVGVLSSGLTDECGDGLSYYTKIAPFVDWIERATGIDISPCGSSGGTWQPTPDCRTSAGIETEILALERTLGKPSATCGPASTSPDRDHQPPEIVFDLPGAVALASWRQAPHLGIRVSDASVWGVREATVLVRRDMRRIVYRHTRSLVPLEFPPVDVSAGSYEISVAASDFAGNASYVQRGIRIYPTEAILKGNGYRGASRPLACEVSSSIPTGGSSLAVFFLLPCLAVLARRHPQYQRVARHSVVAMLQRLAMHLAPARDPGLAVLVAIECSIFAVFGAQQFIRFFREFDAIDGLLGTLLVVAAALNLMRHRLALQGLGFACVLFMVVNTFPGTANHDYLGLIALSIVMLCGIGKPAMRIVAMSGLRWLPPLVLFHSGVQKVLYGTYFRGAYFAHVSADDRFSWFLDVLLPKEDRWRIRNAVESGAGAPAAMESFTGLFVANGVYLAEILVAVLLMVTRTRRAGLVGAGLLVVAIEVVAREFTFGLLLAALLATHCSARLVVGLALASGGCALGLIPLQVYLGVGRYWYN